MRPIRYLLSFAIVLLVSCDFCSCFAQVKITETKQYKYSGFVNPQIVDGVVIASESKPLLVGIESTITVDRDGYKFVQVEAMRVSDFAIVTLEGDGTRFYMPRDSPAGLYRVSARGFDPERGFAPTVSIEVTVSAQPGPTPIDDGNLTVIGKEARKAMALYVQAMAGDMDTVSAEIESGKVNTVLDIQSTNVKRDLAVRSEFKTSMAKILEPKIGNDKLPADAAKTFKEIADGFRSVK